MGGSICCQGQLRPGSFGLKTVNLSLACKRASQRAGGRLRFHGKRSATEQDDAGVRLAFPGQFQFQLFVLVEAAEGISHHDERILSVKREGAECERKQSEEKRHYPKIERWTDRHNGIVSVYNETVTRRNVAGIELPPSVAVFWDFASSKSWLWRSSTFPLMAAAS